jgi:hypothetical protein
MSGLGAPLRVPFPQISGGKERKRFHAKAISCPTCILGIRGRQTFHELVKVSQIQPAGSSGKGLSVENEKKFEKNPTLRDLVPAPWIFGGIIMSIKQEVPIFQDLDDAPITKYGCRTILSNIAIITVTMVTRTAIRPESNLHSAGSNCRSPRARARAKTRRYTGGGAWCRR